MTQAYIDNCLITSHETVQAVMWTMLSRQYKVDFQTILVVPTKPAKDGLGSATNGNTHCHFPMDPTRQKSHARG